MPANIKSTVSVCLPAPLSNDEAMNGSTSMNARRETTFEKRSTLLVCERAIHITLLWIPNANESAAASMANCVMVKPNILAWASSGMNFARAPKTSAITPATQKRRFCLTAQKLVLPAESMDEIASENEYDASTAVLRTGLGTNLTKRLLSLSNLPMSKALARVEKKTVAEVNPIKSNPTTGVPCFAMSSENSPTGSMAKPAKNDCFEEKPNK